MEAITFLSLTSENFNEHSLDTFIRYQEVSECWRRVEGHLILQPVIYTEDWNLTECQDLAKRILLGLQNGDLAYGAIYADKVIGFAYLPCQRFGSQNQYIDLAEFYVSAPFRAKGIGKKLFQMACSGALALGASKLYISAHSAKDSIAAYEHLGCIAANEINKALAQKEPFDIQMEYVLTSN